MIPIRLEMKNFLSYGDAVIPLDFTGMHLACLSGENGNGKSAILDAITWALWGEARGSADELIRLGTDEMRVVFDFEINNDTYRVIKGRSKRSSGNIWELYIVDADSGYRPITGQGIKDTAVKIRRILRMDYKTFVNSAYIQQGRADEFTKQSVGDRKKILADILDLSRYDALEQKAKERRNEADQKVTELERWISTNEAELINEAEWKQELESAKVTQFEFESQIRTADAKHGELLAKQAELDASALKAADARKQIDSLQKEISRLQSQKHEQERRISTAQEIIALREQIVNGISELKSTTEAIASLDKKLDELRSLNNEKLTVEMKVNEAKRHLEIDKQNLEKQLAEIKSKLDAADKLINEIEPLRIKAAELDDLSAKLNELHNLDSESADQYGRLKTQYESAVEQKKDLEEKAALLSKPEAKCPLCLTELDHGRHESILADYKAQINKVNALIIDLKKQATDTKARRESAKKDIENKTRQIDANRSIRERISKADHQIADADTFAAKLPALESDLQNIIEKLTSGGYAGEYRISIKDVESKIAELGYDEALHRRLRESIPDLRRFEQLSVKLKYAEDNITSDESNLHSISELISARERSIEENRIVISELSSAIAQLDEIIAEIKSISVCLIQLRTSDKTLTGQIAALEQSLNRCEQLRKEISSARTDLEKAKKDKSAYNDLIAIFGKKGVQALIIENAIPEIQEEANQLLARMTDNAMQVSIETVRDKKTGGVAETLDIRISDDMGTRAYELYSGGEAFRVNFALRIALSRMLARRAGAKLQTLIIDEGFGTQDGKGREKLIEAIGSIKDDFELILVITHIDELKDAFPTRIEITKDSQGSQITVG